ncbi:MAG: hypothetical protein HY686_04320 [Chloroflexi bacterium]|nr:hypothetical protein [Chloroflexota bacterium]
MTTTISEELLAMGQAARAAARQLARVTSRSIARLALQSSSWRVTYG